jgi:uncharacterized protein
MSALLVSALVAGLVGGAHCVGMCGAFAVACATRHGGLGTLQYSFGRLLTYMLLGAFAGGLGQALSGVRLAGLVVSGALLLYFSLRLAGVGPGFAVRVPWLSRLVGKAARARFPGAQVLFGVANGFIPCGLVYAALALPTASASPVDGAVVMAAFGLGTLPAMFAVGWLSGRLRGFGLGWRRAMAVLVLVAGAWALTVRAPGVMAATDEPPPCPHHAPAQ